MSAAARNVMATNAVCAQVFQSSAERPFAINLLEDNIWLEGQVNVPLMTPCVLFLIAFRFRVPVRHVTVVIAKAAIPHSCRRQLARSLLSG